MSMPNYDMHALQQHILRMLRDFHLVCREHNLHYYLVYGTLLGAVRHKGFIPWDDDIDIALPRPEYDLLIRHAKEWLPAPYEFVCHETDPRFLGGIGKIQDASTTLIERAHVDYLGGVYIDIFPIDGASANRLSQRWEHFRGNCYNKILYLLHRDPYKHGHGPSSWIPLLVQRLLRADSVQRSMSRMYHRHSFTSSTYTIVPCTRLSSVMPKAVYGTPTPVTFEDCELMGVEHADDYLTRVYGDYMQVPDEQHRISHNFHYLNLDQPYRDYSSKQ